MRFLIKRLPAKRKSAVLSVAIAILLGTTATLFAQSPVSYPAALEGQLWKQLLPWGMNTDADGQTIWQDPRDLNNTPSTLKEEAGWTDPATNEPVYRSALIDDLRWTHNTPYGTSEESALLAAQLQFEHLVAVGECTFSHGDDYDIGWWVYWPQVRYCKGPNNEKLPPAPGRLLNPAGIALSKDKVYVTDLFNHRIQVFDFYGNVQPMQFPIGNGVPGNAAYNYNTLYPSLNYRPYGASFNGGYSGHQVSAPYGIALDARQVGGVVAPRILVADSGNHRIAIFNEDGSPAFGTQAAPIHVTLPVPNDASGNPLSSELFRPDLIAVSKNAVVLAPGTVIEANDPNRLERIVITDRVHCYVHIVDPAFNPIKSLPLANPVPSQHDACKEGENGASTLPYEFSTVTGAQIDANGNIFIADHAQNTVQVFDRNGTFITFIGKPGQNNPAGAAGSLLGPVGLLIDDLGRLGVIDAGNARAVFYDLSNGPAQAAFAFQIGITVAVEDFPMGLAFQVGPAAEGLDPKGRILVTDPWQRRMLRFELPEIAIANATATITRPDLNPKEGVASFDVVVPSQKGSAVNNVIVTITPVVPGSVQVNTATVVPSLDARPDILNGQLVHYTFEFTSTIPEVKFNITARGDCDRRGNNCLAEQVEAPAIARAPCATCSATHVVVYEDTYSEETGPQEAVIVDTVDRVIDGRPVTGWYDREVFVRIEPVNAPGTPANDPNRVVAIEWSYGGVNGLLAGTFTNVVDTQLEGVFIDAPVRVGGLSWVSYRAITFEGSASDPVDVLLPLDLTPPTIRFIDWTPRSGTDGLRDWHNQDEVTGTYEVIDFDSGAATPGTGTVSFTAETTNQIAMFTVLDQVGRSADRNSVEATLGREIHIDRHPPIFYAADPMTFTARMTGLNGAVRFATLPEGAFNFFEAFDPPLPSGEPGSRPGAPFLARSNPGTYYDGDPITFTATDYAGNSSTRTATIRIETFIPKISLTGGTFIYDGAAHPALCQLDAVTGAPAVGVVTYSPGGASVPRTAGEYLATCTFNGNENYPAAEPVSVLVHINRRPASITANDNSKIVGQLDPVPLGTFSTSGFVSTDALIFSVSRETGEPVGDYVITPAVSGPATSNYVITPKTGVFRILPDNVAPDCTVAYGGEIWPPNHKRFYAAPINGVTDADGDAIIITVTAILQDEPIDSTGDGKFSPDGQGVGTSTAWVRAERAGHGNKAPGNGRVYEIWFTASDSKASCDGKVFWTVPHDQSQRPTQIDSGLRYDSTGATPGVITAGRDKSQIHQKSPKP